MLGGSVLWIIGLVCAILVIYDVVTNQPRMSGGKRSCGLYLH